MPNIPGSRTFLGGFVTALLHSVVGVIRVFDIPACDFQRSDRTEIYRMQQSELLPHRLVSLGGKAFLLSLAHMLSWQTYQGVTVYLGFSSQLSVTELCLLPLHLIARRVIPNVLSDLGYTRL